jgi:hypothetical protein
LIDERPWDEVEMRGGPADGAAPISDDELTALALAADPQAPIDPDAIPMELFGVGTAALLPEWYMPATMARRGRRWRSWVVLGVIGALLIIEAFGLCSAYGPLTLP